MSTLLDHGCIRTSAVDQVVAPMASHLCHLVLICDGADEPEQFLQLEGAAEAVAKATHNLAAVAFRQAEETQDEVLKMEMTSLLESLTVSGQHVLLAAQKLNIQPNLTEHREELITATQNVFLGVVKVLLVTDDASVRKVLAAADQVLETLSEFGSSPDIKTLLRSFQGFSEALLVLNSLTLDRAHSLQDPRQKQQLLESLETLKRCISMLHTAMCTTIKHPASEQAQSAKMYILDKVQNTVNDIVFTLKSESHMGSLGSAGFYTWRRDGLLQLLSNPLELTDRNNGFDSMIRDLVFHCMAVANSSRREFQQTVVGHCKHILKFWSDIKKKSKSADDLEECEETCILLVQQINLLDKAVTSAVLYQVLDTFLTASSVYHELFTVLNQAIGANTSGTTDVNDVLTLIEDFISYTDRIIQVANFVSALAQDAKSLERVETSIACLTRLRERILPVSLELEDNLEQTLQNLQEVCHKWEEETSQLQDAFSCIINVREFTSLSISEMVIERHGCDMAYRQQSTEQFTEHSTNLISHMKLVMQAARRHLDRSDDPIYRNGLLVLLKQVQASLTIVMRSVRDMLIGSAFNIEVYSSFSDSVSTAIQHFKVLREGLDGQQHPHLLSPLRERARQPDTLKAPSPVMDSCEVIAEEVVRDSPNVTEMYPQSEPEDEELELTIEEELPYKYDKVDLKFSSVSHEPKLVLKPTEFDLLPLLYEVVSVTKGKDVTALNQACTGVLELSNCYAQAAKEALLVVDAVDCQTLESFRAELVSLTPLLVQTAQETAMSSAMRTESIYKHSTQFSDLINNIRKVLLPAAGPWYRSVINVLQVDRSKMAATVSQQLSEVITLCGDVVQQLTSSDIKSQSDGQETFRVLHNKLNKAQNNTRYLVKFISSLEGRGDQLEGLSILWGLSIQILLKSLDKILGTSTSMGQITPQKQLSALSETSLRIQEAAKITSQICKSAHKIKQLTEYKDELKKLNEAYLQAADNVDARPNIVQLAKSEFLKRNLLIKIKAVCVHLSKANNKYDIALQNIVNIAFSEAQHFKEDEDLFEVAAEKLLERIISGTKSVENCLSYIREPRSRSNLRSINEHLSFQISDIISRARLIVETRYICDTLALDVQVQSWAAKAHFVVEEIWKQDGILQGTKDGIRAALQGQAQAHAVIKEVLPEFPLKLKEQQELPVEPAKTSWQEESTEKLDMTLKDLPMSPVSNYSPEPMEKEDFAGSGVSKKSPSLTHRSLYLKQESNHWDPEDNKIVQVTRKMADTICYMTQYLKKKGPIPNKDAFVTAAKDVISNCESVTQFIRVIANHCLDKQCTVELSLIVEQILTITNQLSIISSVNAVTPVSKSSDEILVKNAQNLLQTVLKGVHAAESACITGLKQPEPNTECAEATALCFQWRRNLEMHRAQQTTLETDDLGLRKTSAHPDAPSLAPAVNVQDSYK